MQTKISILFYARRAKSTSDGLVPIYLRVTVKGQRIEQSTKRYVEPIKWSTEQGKMKGNSEEAQVLNYKTNYRYRINTNYSNQISEITDNKKSR